MKGQRPGDHRVSDDDSIDRRGRKVWIGGSECETILDGLTMLRKMAGDSTIPYHVLYHAIRKGRTEVRGVSISTTAPHARQERPTPPRRPEPMTRTPTPLLTRVCTSWLGPHH